MKENTSDYILKKVAPVFNKKGYVATSLSDLEKATNLTKGAIYRNYENKEDLAVKAFKFNIKRVITPLLEEMDEVDSPLAKLYVMTNYYRKYHRKTVEIGGCPLLNIGVNTHFTNSELFDIAQKVSQRLQLGLQMVIEEGIDQNIFKKEIIAVKFSRQIFAMIEGSIFMTCLHNEGIYISNMMDQIDAMIQEKIIK